MKHITTMALMLTLGAAGVYAHQKPVKMTFSGTGAASAINLQHPDTHTGEDNFAGDGTLGPFTFRIVEAGTTSPQFSSTCSGPTQLYFHNCGRRGRVSLPGRKSIECQSHAGRRLHRSRGPGSPLYQ